MAQVLRKTVWQALTAVLPYDPVVLLLGIYPIDLKTYAHTET